MQVHSIDADYLLSAKETMMKNLTLFWVLLAGFSLSACNTTRGLGEDVEATGEGIQHVAEEAEEELKDAME